MPNDAPSEHWWHREPDRLLSSIQDLSVPKSWLVNLTFRFSTTFSYILQPMLRTLKSRTRYLRMIVDRMCGAMGVSPNISFGAFRTLLSNGARTPCPLASEIRHDVASRGPRLENLPTELILQIASKIPYCSSDAEIADLQALRSASNLIDAIINRHERTLTRRISAEQFPIAHYLSGWTVTNLRSLGTMKSHIQQVQDLLDLGRQQRRSIDYDSLLEDEPGWSMWLENWEDIVQIGLWFLQCSSSNSANLNDTARIIDGLPGHACLIMRHTGLL